MGCGSSTDDVRVARLMLELDDSKTKANEQQNLLRFKVEVLVNMLAMEEKKSESIEKRVETLKWLLHEQGVAEQTLTSILLNAEKTDQETRNNMMGSLERSISFRNVGLVDLAGALSRAQEEFELYRADIIPAFAGEDGKVAACLTNDEFMIQLYQVTEKLSKADIQIIALRFGDGSGFVSIPEFLEFFTTPAQMRMAKAATAAVRMSLDLLQLTADEDYLLAQGDEQEGSEQDGEEGDEDAELRAKVLSSHLTNNLDRGVRRLLAMWVHVKKDLESSFNMMEQPTIAERAEDDASSAMSSLRTTGMLQVIELETFKSILLEKCGIKSGVLGHAEMEGKFQVNRTGKPMPSPRPTDRPNSVPKPNAADGIAASGADSKHNSVSRSEDKTSATAPVGMKKEDSRSSLNKAASVSSSKHAFSLADPASTPSVPVVEPLNGVDVDMLAERFELAGCVHYGHFLQYFNELHGAVNMSRRKHVTLPQSTAATASPFVVTSEWQKLRSSAVLKQYAAEPPPPAAPAPDRAKTPSVPGTPATPSSPPVVAAVKPPAATKPATPPLITSTPPAEPKTAVQPAADAKDQKKKGVDAADFKPGQLPTPPGVEVVEPASGMFCCGGGGAARANAKNQPEPLVLPDRADEKAMWVDPNAQDKEGTESEDHQQVADSKSHSQDSSSDDNLPKVDRGFNTPVDRSKAKTKLSFQPRRVVREDDSADEDVQRTGLGKKDRHEAPAATSAASEPDRTSKGRNHFHRRDEGSATATAAAPAVRGSPRAGLESDSGSDDNRANARAGGGRARADSSSEGFSAPRGADTRWK